jgi:PadR family transcriptional regulator, regulatory protein PadR
MKLFWPLNELRVSTTILDNELGWLPSIMKEVDREILLSFWKVHILHHADKEPVVGQWIIRELRRHGYEVSPGTLYPMLARMCARDWLKLRVDSRGGLRARKEYSLTRKGREVLRLLRANVEELYREVILADQDHKS